MENFYVEIAEILEVDSVNMNEELNSFDSWDSLTILSIIAFASESYQIILSSLEINNARTVGGLKALIESKLK